MVQGKAKKSSKEKATKGDPWAQADVRHAGSPKRKSGRRKSESRGHDDVRASGGMHGAYYGQPPQSPQHPYGHPPQSPQGHHLPPLQVRARSLA